MTKRILVVEDQEDNRRILRDLLAHAGFDVIEVGDGEQALTAAAAHHPDVILMDQRLPGTSGAQTTAQILGRLPNTKVVMLTGGATDDEMLDAVEAGVSGYLIKTARVADLFSPRSTWCSR